MHYKLSIRYNDWAREALSSWLFDQGCSGIEEDEDRIEAWFSAEHSMDQLRASLDSYLESLAEMHPEQLLSWNHRVEEHADADWNSEWKSHWQALPSGKRLLVCPSWIEPGAEHEGRIVLRVDPGSAFGTGTHETTGLLLEWLEDLELEQANVLDAGCGTGILGIAALKLGAGFCWGIDIEEEAITAARENAEANGCRTNSHFKVDNPRLLNTGFKFEVVLANIQRSVIEEFYPDLIQALAPGGRLLVSGILAEEEERMRALAGEYDCALEEVRRRGEWIALCYTNPDAS